MRKSRFFNDLHLRKWENTAILVTLVVCTYCACVRAAERDGADSGGSVTVNIHSSDARRQKELNRLREELASAEEALKRLELENESLRENRAELRRELFEISEKYQRQNESYRQLQLWLAGVPAMGTVRKTGEREEQLLELMAELGKSGGELAVNAVSFCEQVRILMGELPIGKVRQAEIQLKLDSLVRDARRFIALTSSGESAEDGSEPLRTCRILAVNRELSLVVLSVGSAKGAFAGMLYQVGKESETQLKVVSVRPFVAAAVVVSGSIDALAPGMEAVTKENRESVETGNGSADSGI